MLVAVAGFTDSPSSWSRFLEEDIKVLIDPLFRDPLLRIEILEFAKLAVVNAVLLPVTRLGRTERRCEIMAQLVKYHVLDHANRNPRVVEYRMNSNHSLSFYH